MTHVMGWTPQLLSVEAMRVAVDTLCHQRHCKNEYDLIFAEPSYLWTEYATYFLALQETGLWDRYHTAVPHAIDIDGANAGRGRPVRGCLHVRLNSVEELQTILRNKSPVVPFFMIDDHKVNGSSILQVVRAFFDI